jgi:tripartite-type tricarboxylate transporter receptor subunit TctC
MANVPTIHELMNEYKTPPITVVGDGGLGVGRQGRPFITSPGLTADRLKTLRDAFQKTMEDPAFVEDVKTRKLKADPDFGEQLEAIARDVVSQPREVVEKMKQLLGGNDQTTKTVAVLKSREGLTSPWWHWTRPSRAWRFARPSIAT